MSRPVKLAKVNASLSLEQVSRVTDVAAAERAVPYEGDIDWRTAFFASLRSPISIEYDLEIEDRLITGDVQQLHPHPDGWLMVYGNGNVYVIHADDRETRLAYRIEHLPKASQVHASPYVSHGRYLYYDTVHGIAYDTVRRRLFPKTRTPKNRAAAYDINGKLYVKDTLTSDILRNGHRLCSLVWPPNIPVAQPFWVNSIVIVSQRWLVLAGWSDLVFVELPTGNVRWLIPGHGPVTILDDEVRAVFDNAQRSATVFNMETGTATPLKIQAKRVASVNRNGLAVCCGRYTRYTDLVLYDINTEQQCTVKIPHRITHVSFNGTGTRILVIDEDNDNSTVLRSAFC
jgi:hypothetical protein